MENLIGKSIDNYKVVSVLGKGGMGIIYKAYDTKLDRYVAIKMLNSQVNDKERFIERFKREAKNQAKLSHPNIVTVYGFIEYSDLLGIVMEYVEGESLEKVIERQGRFNLYDVIYIIKQLLLGIGYAHSKGFVHRDIKPSNIILNKEGITKIMDFGISKSLFDNSMTKTGSKIGTVYYMSPEQIRSEEVTNRSDIYSIGCTAYEMIVGEPPFDFQSEYEVMDAHLKKNPPRITDKMAGIPESVNKILLKALEKNPLNRYNTCEEMFADVQELDNQVAKLTSYFKRNEPRSKKYKIFAVSAFVGFTIVLIGLSYFVYHQVNSLITSNELDKFRKYSIQQLFASDESKHKLSEITKVESGILRNLNSIYVVGDKFAAAVGDSGLVLSSVDGGNTWTRNNLDSTKTLSDIYIFPSGKTLIVGDSSSLYYSTHFIDSLRSIPLIKGFTLFKIKFIDDYTGFITGNKGLILKTVNGGSSWFKVNTNTDEVIFDLSFFNSRKGIAVGWNGVILNTNNGGESWTKSTEPITDNYLKSIDLIKDGYGLIVGGDGTVLRTVNFGKDWEKNKLNSAGGFQKVKFITDNNSIIIGSRGTILISKNKGESWDLVDSHFYSNMNGLAISSYGQVFIVGVNGTIMKIQ
ncbi:MAG: protein kinase [Ignavibacteriales bacterium]|nr:protein kinase [Ignavibacteriales bacterium]